MSRRLLRLLGVPSRSAAALAGIAGVNPPDLSCLLSYGSHSVMEHAVITATFTPLEAVGGEFTMPDVPARPLRAAERLR